MHNYILILLYILTWGGFILFGLLGLYLDIYIIKKYLPQLRSKVTFLQSLTKRIVFTGYEASDGLWLNVMFLNSVGAVLKKKNIKKYKENFNGRLVKLLLLCNRIDRITYVFAGLALMYTLFILRR